MLKCFLWKFGGMGGEDVFLPGGRCLGALLSGSKKFALLVLTMRCQVTVTYSDAYDSFHHERDHWSGRSSFERTRIQ